MSLNHNLESIEFLKQQKNKIQYNLMGLLRINKNEFITPITCAMFNLQLLHT